MDKKGNLMVVLNAEPYLYSKEAIAIWEENGCSYSESTWDAIDTEEPLENVDILIVRLNRKIDLEVVKKFPRLKLIISATTGLDHLDLQLLQSANIEVFSLRGHTDFLNSISSTAEHTWALIGALVRNIPAANESVKREEWDRDRFRGYQLKDKRIGIIGLGRVGQQVAKYASAFDMPVGYFDPYVDNELYQRFSSIEELLKMSDIISIHVHLTNETHHLLNSTNLHYAKDGCFIINTSRGNVWDEDALLDVFKSGRIRGIATDVLADELHNIKESAILNLHKENQNIIITPHLGGATIDAMWSCEKYLTNFVVRSLSDKIWGL